VRARRWWPFLVGAAVVVLLATLTLSLGPWLLTRHPSAGLTADQELAAKNDVRATLVQMLAGVAVGLGAIVTYRTYLQDQRDQDRTYRLNSAAQVNDYYTRAVEHLGHSSAPVRLGALHSLANLGQEDPSRRQTVIDVLCAYLRMPHMPPIWDASAPLPEATSRAVEESQVRGTAQQLLADHLRCPSGVSGTAAQGLEPNPAQSFWPGISLDLTGATLVNFSLRNASLRRAHFGRAAFLGEAQFGGVSFLDDAWFERATFAQGAHFRGAVFRGYADFRWATFSGEAVFTGATFPDNVLLRPAFDNAFVSRLDPSVDRTSRFVRTWPAGWNVCPHPADPSRDTLVAAATV
jgi:hypothetical protein